MTAPTAPVNHHRVQGFSLKAPSESKLVSYWRLGFFSLCKQVMSKRSQLAIRQVVAVVARIMLNNNEWVS